MQFSSPRHAGAFAFALFGLCTLQSVQLILGDASANMTASTVIPPALQEGEFAQTYESIRERTLRERRTRWDDLRKAASEKAADTATADEHAYCDTVRSLMETLKCDAE